MADVEIALGWTVAHASPSSRRRGWWPWAVAAVLALITAAVLLYPREPPLENRPVQLQFNPPPGREFRPADIALSPDGKHLAFVTGGAVTKLWVRALDSLAARELRGTDGATLPFWSADQRALGFFAGGKVKRIDLDSERIVTLADAPLGRGGSWNVDNVILFSAATNGPIWRVSAGGGTPVAATALEAEASHRFPAFLPDGRHFLFYVRAADPQVRGIYWASLDIRARSSVWSRRCSRVSTRHPAPVSGGGCCGGRRKGDSSPNGQQIAYMNGGDFTDGRSTVFVGDVSGAAPRIRLTVTPHSQRTPDWSPDGKSVLFQQTSSEANLDLWFAPVTGERKVEPYLQSDHEESGGRFFPGGKWVAYTSNQSGRREIWVAAFPTPTTNQQVSFDGGENAVWRRDGKELFYRSADGNLMTIPVEDVAGTLRFGTLSNESRAVIRRQRATSSRSCSTKERLSPKK